MAEFAASIIGIISVGTKVSLVLFRVASELGAAGEDVQWLGTEISVFCAVLEDLRSTLQRAQSSGFSMSSLKSMGVILDHCKEILQRIQNVVEKMTKAAEDGTAQKMSVLARAKWVFSKSKVDALRTRLESSKLTLTVMMTGFDWALLLEQKEQSQASQSEAERHSQLFRSLLLSQQFIVQRLENLERSELPNGASGNEAADSITVGLGTLQGNLSKVLNETVFHDGMSASNRRWTDSQSPQLLSSLAQTFVTPPNPSFTTATQPEDADEWLTEPEVVATPTPTQEPKPEPTQLQINVVFKALAFNPHKRFNKEPTSSTVVSIEIFPYDDKDAIKNKSLDKLGIKYHASHYCLHHEHFGSEHVKSWDRTDYEECRKRNRVTEYYLSIQNTLWANCRDDEPNLQWWNPVVGVQRLR